jgi:tetratricopeptide (TPR) repeat protein
LAENSSDSLKAAQAAMQNNSFTEAKELLSEILADKPDLFDAHYMAAVCARYLDEGSQAQGHIDRMKQLSPDFGRIYQEEGHLFARADPERALRAYQFACRQNPTLLASWRGQANLLQAQGKIAAAKRALASGKSVAAQPQALQAAMNHMYEGRLGRAEELCRAFLAQQKHHVEGMRLLAQLAVRFGENDQAEFLLESILEFHPSLDSIRREYIEVLKNRQKFQEAAAQSTVLIKQSPENVQNLSIHGINLMQLGRYEKALDFFDKVLELVPDDAVTLTSKGHALKTMGREVEAIDAYRAAVAVEHTHGDGYYSLANLKTYKFEPAEIDKMQLMMERGNLFPADRVHISFALAKAYEDRGDYPRAFDNYQAGNQLKRHQVSYSAQAMHDELQRQQDICSAALFSAQSGKGHDASDPIFIVGLPRAGSTLVEQILASHSQIDGTLELPNILSLAHKLRGRQIDHEEIAYPQILHDLSAEQLAEYGRNFIDNTQMHRQGAAFFTDKMPNNFRHIGLIHLILPNAKIIDARRNPMDCCFSGYKQLFAQGQEFTYGLEDIGRYYTDYVALMDHWHKVLPGKILHVQHEDVLDDLEGQVRRMLEYLELTFEPACLEFHTTERDVRTASAAQVRQPLNRKGVDAWRPFDAHLQPLKNALGAHFAPPHPMSQKATHNG